MKVFHNGPHMQYVAVTLAEIQYLLDYTNLQLPTSVRDQLFSSVITIDDTNKETIVRFFGKEAVSFFEPLLSKFPTSLYRSSNLVYFPSPSGSSN